MTASQTDPSPTGDDATAAEADSPTAHPPRMATTNRPNTRTPGRQPAGDAQPDIPTADNTAPSRTVPSSNATAYHSTTSEHAARNPTELGYATPDTAARNRATSRNARPNSEAADVEDRIGDTRTLDGVSVGGRRLRFLVPGAVFVGVRGLGLLIFWWLSNVNNVSFSLVHWDATWYLAVAQHGYLGVPTDMLDLYGHHTVTTPMVFFPGFPQLVRLSSAVTGYSLLSSAVVVSTVAGIVASYGVARLARRYTQSPRTAFVMVVLFSAAPMSIVYSMAYPEALLCAFAAWALVGLSERRWVLAGICTAAAGYISPMAAPLILAVVAVALFEFVRGRGGWGAVAAFLMAPAGMLGYFLWVASITGRLDGYLVAQKQGWGSGFDFGRATARWFLHTWSGDRSAFTILTTWIVLAAIVLLVVGWRRRMPWQLWLFSVLTVAFVVGSSGVQWDKVRLLLVAFPLLLPIAITVARQRTWTMTFLLIGCTFIGLWFGAYGLTVWRFSI